MKIVKPESPEDPMPDEAGPSREGLARLRSSASRVSALLKVMANEDRLVLLCQIAESERNVGELQAGTGIDQPTLSQQLGVLRDEGLVETRREGKYVYYRMASDEVLAVMRALYTSVCGSIPEFRFQPALGAARAPAAPAAAPLPPTAAPKPATPRGAGAAARQSPLRGRR